MNATINILRPYHCELCRVADQLDGVPTGGKSVLAIERDARDARKTAIEPVHEFRTPFAELAERGRFEKLVEEGRAS